MNVSCWRNKCLPTTVERRVSGAGLMGRISKKNTFLKLKNERNVRMAKETEPVKSTALTMMDWLAPSPGLNPDEHVWDQLPREKC